jgi:serine kinase of HPr protein (carbohydrate metabolism regulator)
MSGSEPVKSENIYASAVSFDGHAVLIFGPSGSGKSDLSLRLIVQKNASLIADDRVIVCLENDGLSVSAPDNLAGLIEIRGIGLVSMPSVRQSRVALCIELTDDPKKVERMPEETFTTILGRSVPKMTLYPFEMSAADKVVIKLKTVLAKNTKLA